MTLLQYDNSLNQSYKSSVLDGLASGLGWLLHLSLALGRPYLFPRGIQSEACDSNLRSKTEHVEKALKHIIYSASNKLKGKELDLILVILPDNNGSLYGDLK